MAIKLENFYKDVENKIPKDLISIKEEVVDEQSFFIVSYIYNDNSLWHDSYLYEARGITFNSSGEIVCRPFEKFHNLNGHNTTQYKDLDFFGAEIYDKMDGSMLTPVLINGKIRYKTKKSFYSDVAKHCQADFGDNAIYNAFCTECLDLGWTPIFEYTSPKNRVVVDYGSESKLTLLAIRHMTTGEYLDRWSLKALTEGGSLIPLVTCYDNMSISDALTSINQDEETNREGFVVVLSSGQRVKIKYPSYCLLHGKLDKINERDIAKMVIEECIDDFKAMIDPRHLELIESIERNVLFEYFEVKAGIVSVLERWQGKPLPEIGKDYSTHQYFHPAINIFKGKNADEIMFQYFMNNKIPTYPTHNLW